MRVIRDMNCDSDENIQREKVERIVLAIKKLSYEKKNAGPNAGGGPQVHLRNAYSV